MADFLAKINDYLWGDTMVYLSLLTGVFFSLRSRLLQVRHLPEMLRLLRSGHSSAAGVSSFQALAMSLSGRVGTGNIAGVATAIAFGGPGALFWMWVMAFLGASTSFVECTLGQIYKTKDQLTGEYRGGPAYYFSRVLAHTRAAPLFRVFGALFAVVTVIATGLLLPGVQSNSVGTAMSQAWHIPSWTIAVGAVAVVGVIIVGGVKRIAAFASIVVPFMAVSYIVIALVVTAFHAAEVPGLLRMVVDSALGTDSVFGAIVGSAVLWGVRRGIYSNEAGQGNGPHAAAAAEVSHPAKQGLVQAFAVYIDTLFICTTTGLLLLSTGAYRVFRTADPDDGVLAEGGALTPDAEAGPAFAQAGIDTTWAGVGPTFVAVSLAFFCLTTIIAYYYIAETNLRFLLGSQRVQSLRFSAEFGAYATRGLQFLILGAVALGILSTARQAWDLGDIGLGMMSWLNLIGIVIVQQPAFRALRDYERQRKAGLDPVFDPVATRIPGATFWETYQPEATQTSRTKKPAND